MEEESLQDARGRNKKRNTKKTKASKQDMLNYQLIKDCGIDSSDMSKQEMEDLARVLMLSKADTNQPEASNPKSSPPSSPIQQKLPTPIHALDTSDTEGSGPSRSPCSRKLQIPVHTLESSDEESGPSSRPTPRKLSDMQPGSSSHPSPRKLSGDESGPSSRPSLRKPPSPVHTPEVSDEEYMEVNDQETQMGETKNVWQSSADSPQFPDHLDRENIDIPQFSADIPQGHVDSPQCIADSDEETQLVDFEKPSANQFVEELNELEAPLEKIEETNNGNSASDEETQYVITESTLKEDVLTMNSNTRNRNKKPTAKASVTSLSTKKFTQRKIDQFSHVVIPDSPPPKSPYQSSQDSSPIKCRRSVKRPIVESDDEDTQDYYDRKEGFKSHAEEGQQAAKRSKTDITESDEECRTEVNKPPVTNREERKTKQAKIPFSHPAQFLLAKERVDSPASTIKPLCRHYRKSLRKEGCIRTLYSPSIDSVSTYTKAIIQYFEIYHRRLTQLQAKSKCMIEWGQSVKVGKHWDTTIDAKRRGQEVFDLEDSDEEKGNGQDDKALRTNKDQNGKDMSAAIQIDEDDDFDNYVPLRQTRRNKARGRGQGQMNKNDKNEEIARVLNARGKSGKRITHAISLSDSEDDLNEKNNKSKKVSKQLPRNQRKDEIVLDENNQFDACDDESPSQMQEKVSEKSTLSSFKNSESLQMNFSKTDRKSQSKYTFKKTSAGIGDRSSKFNKQKESSPESDGGDKLSDKGTGNEKKCRVVLQRHKSDLSMKSTGSFRSDDLDLECLEEDNVMDKGNDKQGIHINEESTDRLSQSSSALLNSQGDLYSTQYCVRKERSLKVASVRPVLRSSSPEFTGDEATCSGSQKEGKQIDQSNHQIMEDDQSDDGSSAAQGNQRNLESNDSSDDLNDDDGKFVPQDDEENIDIYSSSSESKKENRKGAKRKKFSTERKLQNRKPNATKVSEHVKDSSSEEDMETGVEKSVNEQQEPSFDLPIGHKGGLNGSQEAASSTSKFHDSGMSKLYLSRSPTPEQQFNLDNPKASSSRSEVVDLDIDSSSSHDEIVVRRGSRKRVKTYSKKGKDEQVPPKVKVQEEEKVPCPMCFKPFSVAEIQEHAENCEGETGDVEEDLAVIEETTPISGATRRGTSRGNVREVPTGGGDNREANSPTPAPRGTQKCFLCDKRIAKAKYDAHVDLCLKEATKRQEMADTKGYDQVLDVDDEPELEPAHPRKTRQRVGDRRNQTDRQGQQPRNHTEDKQGQQLNFDGYYSDSDDAVPLRDVTTNKKPTFSWNLPSDNNEDTDGSSSTSSYNLVYYSSSSNSPTKTPVKSSHNTLPGGWTAEELDNSPIRTFVPIWRQKDSEGFTGQFDNLKKKYERQLVKKKLSGKRLTGKRKKPGRRKKRKAQSRAKKSVQK